MRNLIMFCLAALAITAEGAENFAYQAVICKANGQPLCSQSTTVKICLYRQATEGTALWAREAIPVLTDANGLVNIELSDGLGQRVSGVTNTLDEVFAKAAGEGSALYLGLTVEGSSGEIRPRQRMLTTPLASVARDGAGAAGDFVIRGATIVTGATVFASTKAIKIAKKATFRQKSTFKQKATFSNGLVMTGGDLSTMPVNTVVLWWGDPNNPPAGWEICNGLQMPGGGNKPNLVNRFPVGAGGNYGKGAQGGSETVTLTTDQIPTHQHEFAGTDFNGGWKYEWVRDVSDGKGKGFKEGRAYDMRYYMLNYVGGGQSHNNMPPYRTLFYIIKVK